MVITVVVITVVVAVTADSRNCHGVTGFREQFSNPARRKTYPGLAGSARLTLQSVPAADGDLFADEPRSLRRSFALLTAFCSRGRVVPRSAGTMVEEIHRHGRKGFSAMC